MERENLKEGIGWKSSTLYVDKETGLIISKKLAEREYIITKKYKTYEVNKDKGIIKYTNECEKSKQISLWVNEQKR